MAEKKGLMGEFSHPSLTPELLQRKCFLKHILHRCSFCFTVSQTLTILHKSKVSQFGLVKFSFKRQQNMNRQNRPNTRVSSVDDFPCSSVLLLSSCYPWNSKPRHLTPYGCWQKVSQQVCAIWYRAAMDPLHPGKSFQPSNGLEGCPDQVTFWPQSHIWYLHNGWINVSDLIQNITFIITFINLNYIDIIWMKV